MDAVFDVAIIGGGINGCGCAADAALRGLSVILIEQDDLASKTSSKSSKLIHGGLRYLENYDFSLVKKALNERQTLLQLAPYLVHPLPFVLPHQRNMRPLWLLRLGLLFYDFLSRINTLPHTQLIRRKKQAFYFNPLINQFSKGFLFYDAAADDARLTIINALQAEKYGAKIALHTKVVTADVVNEQWQLSLQAKNGDCRQINAKTIINASGPWVEKVNQLLKIPQAHTMSLVKGSHIVVKKLYEGDHAYMLQNSDMRIVFAIPYHNCTLVGTTDVTFSGSPEVANIDIQEIEYLCNIINSYFNEKINKNDIITTWSGIRPLLANTHKTLSTLSRDYSYHYTNNPAPAVTIYGGKITTYRQLAVEVINALHKVLPNLPASRTAQTPLPGATNQTMDYAAYRNYAQQKYAWLEEQTRQHYLNNYGTNMEVILTGCNQMSDLGRCFGPTFYQVEIDYLIQTEWAHDCEDILWRRTKHGLHLNEKEVQALETYLLNRENFPPCLINS